RRRSHLQIAVSSGLGSGGRLQDVSLFEGTFDKLGADSQTCAKQMKRLRFIRIVLVLVLGCLTIAIFRAREPRYQGRTLSEWIKVGDDAYSAFTAHLVGYPYNELEADPGWKASSHAVRQMGTKAIPFLLN